MLLSMASMAAPAGNPANLTSEPIPHRVTSHLGLPVTTRERLFTRGLGSVVPPPTPQGALGLFVPKIKLRERVWLGTLLFAWGPRTAIFLREMGVYGCPPARPIGAAQLQNGGTRGRLL